MHWGTWHFDSKQLTLIHAHYGYQIDVKRIHSSAAILDWIFQILGKNWADAQTMHDLLRAFWAILDPQANYCPWERDTRANGAQLARKLAHRLGNTPQLRDRHD